MATELFFRNAIKELAPTHEELFASESWGSVKSVSQPVFGEGFHLFAVLQDKRGAVACGEINSASSGDRGTVDITQAGKALAIDVSLAGLGVGDGQQGLVGLGVIKQSVVQHGRRNVGRAAFFAP